jgi:outer membrane protein TolC
LLPAVALLAALLAALSPAATPAAAASPPEPGLALLDAVELLLDHDPNLFIQEARLESSRGALLTASSRFDPVVSSGLATRTAQTPLSETQVSETDTLETTLSLGQELRSGLSLEPSLTLTQTDEPGLEALNVGSVTFTFRQPLLRDRGRTVVAAGERAAERELSAADLDLRHTVSQRVLAVTSQYWRVVSARHALEILEASEQSSRELLRTTRRLIEADLTPAAEVVLLEADLAAKESSRIGGERDLFQARQELGREIGLTPEEIAALPLPSEPFPTPPSTDRSSAGEAAALVALAFDSRADLAAARQRLEGAQLLTAAADNGLRPRLDLVFTPGWTGLVEGSRSRNFLASLYRNVPGLSSSLVFELTWPTVNRRAQGELLQARAGEEESRRFVELLMRSIGADVPTALDAVRRGAQQLERAVRAVELFEQAVINEEKKLRAGTSTLIDVISQKDRLTSSRLTEVSAHLSLALALADLRFQTGTLLAAGGDSAQINRDRLTTLPRPGEEAP